MAIYKKPDVEIVQALRTSSVTAGFASLQAAIIGPSFKKIKLFDEASSTDVSLGVYAGARIIFPMPELPANSLIDPDKLSVTIKNYAGATKVERSLEKASGINAAIASIGDGEFTITDTSADFTNCEIGHYVCIDIGPAAGYYEVTEIEDTVLTVKDSTAGTLASFVASAAGSTPVEYSVVNLGWRYEAEEKKVRLTPFLGRNGTVYMSGTVRRRDYVDSVVTASSIEELEEIFGAGEITFDNPLAMGMRYALQYIGTGEPIVGIMVDSDKAISYQHALEVLKGQSVYALVPLTTDPVVIQMLSEHCTTMSLPEEKRNRIGFVNFKWYNREIKSGLMGAQDPETGTFDFAKGSIVSSGTRSAETVVADITEIGTEITPTSEDLVKSVNVSVAGYTRFNVYTDGIAEGHSLTFKYSTEESNPETFEALTAEVSSGYYQITMPVLNEGASVNFLQVTLDYEDLESDLPDDEITVRIAAYKTDNEAAASQFPAYHNLFILPESSTVKVINVDRGHKAIKVRKFVLNNNEVEPMKGALPAGLSLSVTVGGVSGYTKTISEAGTYSFPEEIVQISYFNSSNATSEDAKMNAVELAVLVADGTYKINQFNDAEGTFISDNVVSGDELVLIDKSIEDPTTESGYGESVYKIGADNSVEENSLRIDRIYDELTESFKPFYFEKEQADIYYRVQTPIITNKATQAGWYKSMAEGLGNRRIVSVFAPSCGVPEGTTTKVVPGYYVSCALAGAVQSREPQQGFTNMDIAGFSKVFNTHSYFSESQLDTIASGGNMVIAQDNNGPLYVRHQLTTDMISVESRELSITKSIDYFALTIRQIFKKYIGRYNVNTELLNTLFKIGSAVVNRAVSDGLLGPESSVDKFDQDPDSPDTIIACFTLEVRYPANNIKLRLVI